MPALHSAWISTEDGVRWTVVAVGSGLIVLRSALGKRHTMLVSEWPATWLVPAA